MSWLMNLWMLGGSPAPPQVEVEPCVSANAVHETIVSDAIKQTISANAVREPIQAVRCGSL